MLLLLLHWPLLQFFVCVVPLHSVSILLLGKRNRAGFPTVVAARRGMVRLGRDKQGVRYLRDAVSGFADLKAAKANRIGLDSFRAACKKELKRVKAGDKKVAPK